MNDDHNNLPPELHLHDDPEHTQMESLLELLAKQDAQTMPSGLETRVLESISHTFAPPPLSMTPPIESTLTSGLWSLRYAAAAILATGTTLLIVGTQPWASSPHSGPNQPTIALASLEQDLDAYFALESMDDGNLAEAVTDWEFWAQSIDTDIDSSISGYDWDEYTSDDGAL